MRKYILLFTLLFAILLVNKVALQTICRLSAQTLWTEYACIEVEGGFHRVGDTVRVHGLVQASDAHRATPFSRYAYMEVTDARDSVRLRVKVRCDATGHFQVSLHTDYTWTANIYYIRAYTRLMQNFNPLNFPICAMPLGKELPPERDAKPSVRPDATIQAVVHAGNTGVQYQLAPNAMQRTGYRLFVLHSGGVLDELPLPEAGKSAYFTCGKGLCSLFLVDTADAVVTEKHVWIGEADEMVARGELYSSQPFPHEMDSAKRQRAVGAWLATAQFTRFSLSEVLQGKFRYRYPFEDKMIFGGHVSQESGKPLTGGTLVAYNTETDKVYEADIDSAGHFLIAVDDFPDGTRFYLQAHDSKGKTGPFSYALDDEVYPPVVNPLRKRIATLLSAQDSIYYDTKDSIRRLDLLGWQFSLPEIVVKNRVLKEEERHSERFYQNDYKGRGEIQKKNYLSLLQILQDMPGIRVMRENATNVDGAGLSINSTGLQIRPTRGNSTLAGAEIPVLLDGSRVELNSILHMPVEEIESVEYLKAWQALAYVAGAIDGAISIRTRGKDNPASIRSKGCFVTPLGLTE